MNKSENVKKTSADLHFEGIVREEPVLVEKPKILVPVQDYPEWGALNIVESYFTYDGMPRLFLARAANDKSPQFLVSQLDESNKENELWDTWLYVQVSETRLRQIHKGEVTLRDAYLDAEAEEVYLVTSNYSQEDYGNTIIAMSPDELSDDWLADEDITLFEPKS